jgi:hypothetical protein
MNYPEPYKPDEDLIKAHMERIKKQRLRKMRKSNSKSSKPYSRNIINVPYDTKPVVGTKYQ